MMKSLRLIVRGPSEGHVPYAVAPAARQPRRPPGLITRLKIVDLGTGILALQGQGASLAAAAGDRYEPMSVGGAPFVRPK